MHIIVHIFYPDVEVLVTAGVPFLNVAGCKQMRFIKLFTVSKVIPAFLVLLLTKFGVVSKSYQNSRYGVSITIKYVWNGINFQRSWPIPNAVFVSTIKCFSLFHLKPKVPVISISTEGLYFDVLGFTATQEWNNQEVQIFCFRLQDLCWLPSLNIGAFLDIFFCLKRANTVNVVANLKIGPPF